MTDEKMTEFSVISMTDEKMTTEKMTDEKMTEDKWETGVDVVMMRDDR